MEKSLSLHTIEKGEVKLAQCTQDMMIFQKLMERKFPGKEINLCMPHSV